jgi:hypothetical protein
MALSRATEFDAFLFAPIGEAKNGMLLSVVSALARLDRDPWREAAELTRMPKETAKRRLTSLIEALPNRPWTGPEPGTISACLIALLPDRAGPSSLIASNDIFHGAGAALNSRALIFAVLVSVTFVAGMIGGQRAAAGLHPSASADSTLASVSAIFSRTSSTNSNQ